MSISVRELSMSEHISVRELSVNKLSTNDLKA